MTKLNEEKRTEIRILSRIRNTSRTALARQFGVSWQTIDRVLRSQPGPRVRSTRQASATVRKRRGILQTLTKRVVRVGGRQFPAYCSVGDLRVALVNHGIVASPTTIKRDLHHLGLEPFVRRRVPTRDPRVLADRVKFCKRWIRRQTRAVVFSDEHTCSINDHSSRMMWAKSVKGVIPRERRRMQNIPRIMVWGAVGIGFKSELVIFPQMAGSNSFRLDSKGYVRRCLSKVVPELLRQKRIFQQDGARPHVSAHTKRYLESKGVTLMESWPPYSPDLNCSELMWPLLNRRIAAQHPTTLAELIAAARKAWASITQAEIDAICADFPRRLRLVASGDGHTL